MTLWDYIVLTGAVSLAAAFACLIVALIIQIIKAVIDK